MTLMDDYAALAALADNDEMVQGYLQSAIGVVTTVHSQASQLLGQGHGALSRIDSVAYAATSAISQAQGAVEEFFGALHEISERQGQ